MNNIMSNNINTQLAEELADLEEEYRDDLEAMNHADEDFRDAYDWKYKMIEKCNASAKKLSAFKEHMKHD